MVNEWAKRWGIPAQAMSELMFLLASAETDPASCGTGSEAAAQNEIRLEASAAGGRLWRNNVGVAMDKRGKPIRYGLCNDSKALNQKIKSSDLIGIMPVVVTPDMLGKLVGVFIAREVKAPGWKYTGTEREQAQLKFIEIVRGLGGNAAFATGKGTI